MTKENLCLFMISTHLEHGETFITSWQGFYYAHEIGATRDLSTPTLLKAVKMGSACGWLKPEWVGIGMTPYAGSARRQRVWNITAGGKDAAKLAHGRDELR